MIVLEINLTLCQYIFVYKLCIDIKLKLFQIFF